MKRLIETEDNAADFHLKKLKVDIAKSPIITEEDEIESGFNKLDENLLYEVLKHADARTLAVSACVNKEWHKTAQEERLWELICTLHWFNIGCGTEQLRSVFLALGGFRRLHSSYLWPLSKPSTSTPPRLATSFSMLAPGKSSMRGGEKMQFLLCHGTTFTVLGEPARSFGGRGVT